MFERLTARAARIAEAGAARRREALAARLAAELPTGIAAEAAVHGVRLHGRGLIRRYALEADLRRLIREPAR